MTRLSVSGPAKGPRPIAAGQLLIEITSNSLNRSYGPAKDVPTADLVSDLNHVENFGMIEIDWTARRLSLSLRGWAAKRSTPCR